MTDERDYLIENIREQLDDEETIEKLGQITKEYKRKSEDEIFIEIIRLNEEMEQSLSKEKYKEILDKLDSIRPFLTAEQNKKLDFVLEAMNKD